MKTFQTPALSVVVWANIFEVNRYLGDIVNIVRCIPDITEATHGEGPDEVAVTSREFGAALTSCGLDHTPQRTEWHVEGPVGCTGTILVFGDASISQLRSTLQLATSGDRAGQALVHMRFLRELADRIEAGQHHGQSAQHRGRSALHRPA
ncbi:MAG TPA: hypothetical protein VFD94_12315 [Jatrophihabitans sp.]|jgi:hypothetical protein|nr:hypothetical protein [Jatrophihabitans sp.]